MRTYEYRMDVFIRNVIKRVPSPCTLTLSLKRKEDFFSEFWLLCCVSANQVFQNQFCVPMVVVGWCCSVSYAQQNNNFHLRQPTKSLVKTCLSTQCKRERGERYARQHLFGKDIERERKKAHQKQKLNFLFVPNTIETGCIVDDDHVRAVLRSFCRPFYLPKIA